MPIDGRAVRLYQDVLLIRRHDVAFHSTNHSSTGIRGIKQRLDHFARLERAAFNALSISRYARIAFTIRQRTHRAHRLGGILITRYVTKRYLLRKYCSCRQDRYSRNKYKSMYQKVLFHLWFHFCHNISNAQFIQHLDEFPVKRFVRADTFGERYIDDFIVADTHHHIALPLFEGFDSTHACARRQDAVMGRG